MLPKELFPLAVIFVIYQTLYFGGINKMKMNILLLMFVISPYALSQDTGMC
jgi:hypothetical protein